MSKGRRRMDKVTWSKEKTENRPATQTALCPVCGQSFAPMEQIIVRVEEQGRFRGDDLVEFFHPYCDPRILQKSPVTKQALEALKLMYQAWDQLMPCLKTSSVQDYDLVLTKAPVACKAAIRTLERLRASDEMGRW